MSLFSVSYFSILNTQNYFILFKITLKHPSFIISCFCIFTRLNFPDMIFFKCVLQAHYICITGTAMHTLQMKGSVFLTPAHWLAIEVSLHCWAESSLPNCYAHARSSASWRAPSRGKIINKTKPSRKTTIKKIRRYPSFLDQLKPTKIVLTWIFMTSQFFEVTRLTWTGCNVFFTDTRRSKIHYKMDVRDRCFGTARVVIGGILRQFEPSKST